MILRRPSRGTVLGSVGLVSLLHTASAVTDVPPVRAHFPRLQGDGDPGHVALTFDDGPDAEGTPEVLAALAAADVRATFFLLGAMAERFPDMARRVAGAGHEIGVHGYDHRNQLGVPPGRTIAGISRARDTIERITGVTPRLHRPPYGVLSAAGVVGARRAGLRTVLWGTWGKDWEPQADGASVLANVERGLRGGVTVLLHDSDCTSSPGSWRATVGALPGLLRRSAELGLTVGPLRDHHLPATPAAALRTPR
jgi:peptidoglycan/xylan/chitin deacetylase (PgdA/CDA1 family)